MYILESDIWGCLPLVLELLVLFPHQVPTDVGLEQRDDPGKTLVTQVLKCTEHTSTEEHLGVTQSVFIFTQLEGFKDLASHDLAVDESLGDGIGSQDGVSGEVRNRLWRSTVS